MKTVLTLILVALALTGCASTEYAQYSKAQTDIATARHAADAAKYKAMSDIAASGDSAAKVAAVIAMAMGVSSGVQNTVQAPQASQALQWAQVLVPGLTQVAGMRYNYLSQQTQSNNATALGISTNATFAGIAGRIQAPGAVTTTTTTDRHDTVTTLSGTGTLGSGAYSTQDRHDVTSPTPVVVTPVTPIVPTVVPTVITPVTPIVPTVITPVTPIVPTVVPTVITPVTPIVPTVITPVTPIVPTVIQPVVQVVPIVASAAP